MAPFFGRSAETFPCPHSTDTHLLLGHVGLGSMIPAYQRSPPFKRDQIDGSGHCARPVHPSCGTARFQRSAKSPRRSGKRSPALGVGCNVGQLKPVVGHLYVALADFRVIRRSSRLRSICAVIISQTKKLHSGGSVPCLSQFYVWRGIGDQKAREQRLLNRRPQF